jgi:hypothetical protein
MISNLNDGDSPGAAGWIVEARIIRMARFIERRYQIVDASQRSRIFVKISSVRGTTIRLLAPGGKGSYLDVGMEPHTRVGRVGNTRRRYGYAALAQGNIRPAGDQYSGNSE